MGRSRGGRQLTQHLIAVAPQEKPGGLVGGDALSTAPTLTTGATAASHVGSYPITDSGAAASAD